MLPYWVFLIAVSLPFIVAERLVPWRAQALLRPGWVSDLIYIFLNGYLLGIVLEPAASRVTPWVDTFVVPALGSGHVSGWPAWLQFLLAFFVVDLMQWSVHNLLHRLPWLWSLHRVHHSIVHMDWIGSMRFHWGEIVVYRSLQYVPLLLLGFGGGPLLLLAVVSTAIGHFNHSNLRVPMGPLRYLLNHPGMHIWHHDHTLRGRSGCNFGINLSLWDWLFGTAYLPESPEQPERLGFEGVEHFPADVVRQELLPWSLWLGRKPRPGGGG